MTDDWTRVLGHAKFDAQSQRLVRLVGRTLSRFPRGTPPLKSVTKLQLRKRGQTKGVVGLTTYCCIEIGARKTNRREQKKKSQRITFYLELLNQLSDDAAVGVIAHELAHAWLNENSYPEDSMERESEADELAKSWGYGEYLDALAAETEPL